MIRGTRFDERVGITGQFNRKQERLMERYLREIADTNRQMLDKEQTPVLSGRQE